MTMNMAMTMTIMGHMDHPMTQMIKWRAQLKMRTQHLHPQQQPLDKLPKMTVSKCIRYICYFHNLKNK